MDANASGNGTGAVPESSWQLIVQDNWPKLVLAGVAFIVAIGITYALIDTEVKGRESALFAVLLFVASTYISYVLTDLYSKKAAADSLRDHGVQIARGIMVLKRQVKSLSAWVADRKDTASSGPHSSEIVTQWLDHIEETLDCFDDMTDAALSGIASVIGDALAQYQNVMNRISELRQQQSEGVVKLTEQMQHATSAGEIAELRDQVRRQQELFEGKINALAMSSAFPVSKVSATRTFPVECPCCSAPNTIDILDRPGETRILVCEKCAERSNVHRVADKLIVRRAPRPVTSFADLMRAQVVPSSPSADDPVRALKKQKLYVPPEAIHEVARLAVRLLANGPVDREQLGAKLREASDALPFSRTAVRVVVYQWQRAGLVPRDAHVLIRPDIAFEELLGAYVAGIARVLRGKEFSLGAPELVALLLGPEYRASPQLIASIEADTRQAAVRA